MKKPITNLELAEILLAKPSEVMRTLLQNNHARRLIRKRRDIGTGRISFGAALLKAQK